MYPNITDETLRKLIENGYTEPLPSHYKAVFDALDSAYGEIKQLREENEKLKKEVEKWQELEFQASMDIIAMTKDD